MDQRRDHTGVKSFSERPSLSLAVNFDATELARARYTIYANIYCCAGWIVLNASAAMLLGTPRLFGLAASALAMIVSWALALRDLSAGNVARGVLNYVISWLLLLLCMGLFAPEMSVLFMFATFSFLAFGLSYASAAASSFVVALTMLVAGALLFVSVAFDAASGVEPGLMRWVNVIGMTMALSINAVSFAGLRKTLDGRAERLSRDARERLRLEEQLRQSQKMEAVGGALPAVLRMTSTTSCPWY